MFVTLTNIQNGFSSELPQALDNRHGCLKIALREITFYPAWVNIHPGVGFLFDGERVEVPRGYYSVCTLDKVIFRPLGVSLKMNEATGRLTLSLPGKSFIMLQELAPILGFTDGLMPRNGTTEADQWPDLVPHKEIFVHLDELSTSENVRITSDASSGSTLLRAIAVTGEGINCGKTASFPNPQFKNLRREYVTKLTVSLLDISGKRLDTSYLSAALEITT